MDLTAWIETYAKAWRDKDSEAIVSLFTPDAVYHSSPTGPGQLGAEGIAAYWRRATATQRDLDLRFGRPLRDGNRAVVEWWATMRDPDWRPDADTDEVTLPGCLILDLVPDGRCRELWEYYNPVFGQIVAPPATWG